MERYHVAQNTEGLMEYATFYKPIRDGRLIRHHTRIIIHIDTKKHKVIDLPTNDIDSASEEIVNIYRLRWKIDLLFKQIKPNFPLHYFYGESGNAIKIQI